MSTDKRLNDIHKSRKLKRFADAYADQSEANQVFRRAETRFYRSVDNFAFRVDAQGWVYISEDGGHSFVFLPKSAYALYQLLDRAFGKD